MKYSIIDFLEKNSQLKPNNVAFRFLSDKDLTPVQLTHHELWEEVQLRAEQIRHRAEPGECVLLLFPSGLDYIVTFYACLAAGVIAVPLYPPTKSNKVDRITKVAQSCNAKIALTVSSEIEKINECFAHDRTLQAQVDQIAVDTLEQGDRYCKRDICPEQVAFLQYTSGSTGAPKGVMISHKNIIGNVAHLTRTASGTSDDIFVNWLPLFHDLGLVTAILWPVYLGTSSTLMSPATFVREPLNWLQAINDYKGTMCGAPNFAYNLCAKKVPTDALKQLDLSSWKVAYNAAEPVNADTLRAFSTRFEGCGFEHSSFYPGYGMAEATVFITGVTRDDAPNTVVCDKASLAAFRLDQESKQGDSEQPTSELVSCGYADGDHHVCIVDPETKTELADGLVGEVWFSGPSVANGYWGLEEITSQVFAQSYLQLNGERSAASYLRTGDLGLIKSAQLYITGRHKDLIIFQGKNFYPQDIEHAACEAHSAVRSGYSAAFSVEKEGEEALILVTELTREAFRKADYQAVCDAIRATVYEHCEAKVTEVVLLKPYTIPMTSSGKIQRRQAKAQWDGGTMQALFNVDAAQVTHEVIKPDSDLEKVIHDIWCKYLELESISVTSKFYQLGGDSINAIEIAADVCARFSNENLSERDLLELDSVRAMSDHVVLKQSLLSPAKVELSEGALML
ncbi:amino acid adenylation protein [Pseudoalteromonas citrea]|uniref:Amino acid adenylation protein n=1 Tax=Pseudoalteromonas citrea TaxID=43655 RepID=A0A5S3XNH4_9GAMM|nr:AMP-binding protein [Pseudoalteromonas citrea]TMP43894.1 amino acid adenylation protein [Pseudoalteromonas citrea]TMP58547.1 amino acid adenylation protein [Pseudoalteromonas citrea]